MFEYFPRNHTNYRGSIVLLTQIFCNVYKVNHAKRTTIKLKFTLNISLIFNFFAEEI